MGSCCQVISDCTVRCLSKTIKDTKTKAKNENIEILNLFLCCVLNVEETAKAIRHSN